MSENIQEQEEVKKDGNGGNGEDKHPINPRIILEYNDGKVAVSGTLPNNPVIAFGMLERARFVLHQFYMEQQMKKESLRLHPNIKTNWLRKITGK